MLLCSAACHFFFTSRSRHTRFDCDWSSDVCSSDLSLWGLRLAICQGFDQYACVRPVRLLPGVQSPLRDATPERVDWVVVRENSEGEYAGIEIGRASCRERV